MLVRVLEHHPILGVSRCVSDADSVKAYDFRARFRKNTRSSTRLLGRGAPASFRLLVCATSSNTARSAGSGLSKVRRRRHRALPRGVPREGRAAHLAPHTQAASRPALRARSSCAAEVGRPGRTHVDRARSLPSHPRRPSDCGSEAVDQGWRGNDPRLPTQCEGRSSRRLVRRAATTRAVRRRPLRP